MQGASGTGPRRRLPCTPPSQGQIALRARSTRLTCRRPLETGPCGTRVEPLGADRHSRKRALHRLVAIRTSSLRHSRWDQNLAPTRSLPRRGDKDASWQPPSNAYHLTERRRLLGRLATRIPFIAPREKKKLRSIRTRRSCTGNPCIVMQVHVGIVFNVAAQRTVEVPKPIGPK